ncbi:MAG: hypothetical protein A2Y59_00535 [Chloroflexi bacterium RBG_13_52_14]|nr:MAG: hypothetical protein A2Y59_00535 [Chloroflexi bacterium RBG_13_52_14]
MAQNDNKPQPIHIHHWSKQRKNELLRIGVEAFCQKYEYRSQGKSAVVRVYNQLTTSKRQGHIDDPGPKAWRGGNRKLPEIVQAAVNKLPPADAILDKQRLDTLKLMMVCALDLGYGE